MPIPNSQSSLPPSHVSSLVTIVLQKPLDQSYPLLYRPKPPPDSPSLFSLSFPGPSPGQLLPLLQRQCQNALEIKLKLYPQCDQLSPAGSLLSLLLSSQRPSPKHFPNQVGRQAGKAPGGLSGRAGGWLLLRASSHDPANLHHCHFGVARVGEEQGGCRASLETAGLPGLPHSLPGL